MCITSKGDLKVKDTSTGCVVELKNARKSKDIKKNIVSIGQLQNEGWTLRCHDSILFMDKEDSFVSKRMLWAAGFTKEMKSKLLGEAMTTAIFLHDIAPTARNKKSAYELWTGKAP